MSKLDIIRAWKDVQFRQNLSEEELALLPAHPAGEIQLSEEELAYVNGGVLTRPVCEHTGPPHCTVTVTCL